MADILAAVDRMERYTAGTTMDGFSTKAMRNIAAHEYFGIDVATVWQTARVDVPGLRPLLQALLAG